MVKKIAKRRRDVKGKVFRYCITKRSGKEDVMIEKKKTTAKRYALPLLLAFLV